MSFLCPTCEEVVPTEKISLVQKKIDAAITDKDMSKNLEELTKNQDASQEQITELEKQLKDKDYQLQEKDLELSQTLLIEREKIKTDLIAGEANRFKVQFEELKESHDKHTHQLEVQITQQTEQIKSINKKLEEAQKKTVVTSPVRIGEAGEIVLKDILKKEFNDDKIIENTSGKSEPDLVQTIIENGRTINDVLIGYDNKENKTVGEPDVKQSILYKNNLKLGYMIIVGQNFKKEWDKPVHMQDGILLVKTSVIIPIIKLIRKFILENYNQTKALENKEEKSDIIYAYITSPVFTQRLDKINSLYTKITEHHLDEVQKHQTLWKNRMKLYESLKENIDDIVSEIDSVTKDDIPLES